MDHSRTCKEALEKLLTLCGWALNEDLSDAEVRREFRVQLGPEEEHLKTLLARLSQETKGKPTPRDYASALTVQDACNLSGVVFSFSEILPRIMNEMRERGEGHDWRDRHPIVRLFSEQISHLGKRTSYTQAYEECLKKSKEDNE